MSCLDIAQYCPSLHDLLTKPIEIDTIPILIPWTSVSNKCKGILAKVARQQECKMVDQIWYYRDQIAGGTFGLIFAGISEKDRWRRSSCETYRKCAYEATRRPTKNKNLTALADCEQVVRYISIFEDGNFSYIVLELMEGNLKEYLDGSKIEATQATFLCKDVVLGLE